MKKIVFISDTTSVIASTSIRHDRLIKYLSSANEVITIKSRHSYYIKVKQELNRTSVWRRILISVLKHIKRILITEDEHFLCRKGIKKQLKKIKHDNSIDVIILGIMPHSFLPLARYIKKYFSHVKLVIDISDPFYANVKKKYRSLLKNTIIFYYERYYLRFADTITVLNKEVGDFYKDTYKLKCRIEVVEQGFERYQTKTKTQSPDRLITSDSKSTIKLIYGGHFYYNLRDPEFLFNALEEVNLDIRLNIYGGGFNWGLKAKHICNKIFFYESIPQEQLDIQFQNSDIIVFLDNQYGIQVPGKTLEILKYGKPILFISSHSSSPSSTYLVGYKGLVHVKNNSHDIIIGLSKCIEMRDHNYEYPELQKYTWEHLVEKLENLI